MPPIILASKSPRRKHLLELAEIDFDIITEDTDEGFEAHLSIGEIPIYIARNKAKAIAAHHRDRIILAADTVVVLNNTIIGKPANRDHAIEILSTLSGQTHEVITGVVILWNDQEIAFSDTTKVSFHDLTADQIVYYVDRCQPFDKAGAYAIQEWIGAIGIKRIEGCFYNVMGLPISLVKQQLQRLSQ